MKNFYKATLLLVLEFIVVFGVSKYFPYWQDNGLSLGALLIIIGSFLSAGLYILFGIRAFKENVFLGGTLFIAIGSLAIGYSVLLIIGSLFTGCHCF